MYKLMNKIWQFSYGLVAIFILAAIIGLMVSGSIQAFNFGFDLVWGIY